MHTRILGGTDNEDRGFTLIELLVVIIVVGILAAIAIPAFLQQRAKAHATAALSDARSVAEGVASANLNGKTIASFSGGPNNTYIVNFTDGTTDSYQTQPFSPGTVTLHSWIDPSGAPYCVETQNADQYAQARDTGVSTSSTSRCATKPAGAIGS